MMEQLGALDAMFAYTETRNTPMHIGQLLIYDPATAPGGKVGFKDILSYIEGRLDGAGIFRRKLVRVPFDLDHPYWIEDENFDLEYHVRHIALPQPGDWRQLCIQAARIYARPLDMDRPLWEFTVIEGLDNVEGVPKGSFAVMHKLHHAAMDGQSGLQMTVALHDLDAKMTPRKWTRKWQPEAKPSDLTLLARAQVNNIANPVRGLKTLSKLLPIPKQIFNFTRDNKQQKGAGAAVPKTRLNRKMSPHRVFDATAFTLDDIKTIRAAFPGATVNDVMLTVVGGTLRAYLDSKGELPEVTLKAGAPVSLRDSNGDAAGGNQVAMMQVGLGTHLTDPAERLAFVARETSRSKGMNEAVGAKALMELSGAMPAGLTAAATKLASRMGLGQTTLPQINTVVTNVPGPPSAMYFAGSELKRSFGMGLPVDGLGVFHTVTSYNRDVMLTITADRDMLPDPAVYIAMAEKSFGALMAAAKKASAAAAKNAKVDKPAEIKPNKRLTTSSATAGKGRKK
ncbi:MAG: wax ester/triacylglycerol synthase family O-acyltransferase [Parasphingorhabdus sp.]|uniref:WS/DGAT/MGAT family O-acyltransferase n=1 Tax=Parasphingorhabdus sp. TaxID=2709688 RepID=UPI00300368C2